MVTIDGDEIVSGSTIDGDEIQEITMDGDVVWEASTIVDNFEASPDGPYESGDTVTTFYSGDTGTFERESTTRLNGDFALRSSTSGDDFVASLPGDGLPYYPERGDTFSCLVDQETTNSYGAMVFGAEQHSGNGYMALVNPYTSGSGFQIREYDNYDRGDFLEGDSSNASSDTVYRMVVNWGTDNNIDAEFYEHASNSLVATVNVTPDSDFNGRGVGFGSGGTSGNVWWDDYQLV